MEVIFFMVVEFISVKLQDKYLEKRKKKIKLQFKLHSRVIRVWLYCFIEVKKIFHEIKHSNNDAFSLKI